MVLHEIIIILVAHYIADFIFQSDWMAMGKSKETLPLLAHVLMYAFVVFVIMYGMFHTATTIAPMNLYWFALINGVLHYATDYIMSRIVSYKFKHSKPRNEGDKLSKGLNFNAFAFIGLDQLIHYICLFSTYFYLFKS